MISNVIDNRKRPYRWANVNAIVEPTWHTNGSPDSDQAEVLPEPTPYQAREGISVTEAIEWAMSQPFAATLWLYDERDGTALRRAVEVR